MRDDALPRRAHALVKRFVGVCERIHYYLEAIDGKLPKDAAWIARVCEPTHYDIKSALLGSSSICSHPSFIRLLFRDDAFKDLRDQYVHMVDMLERQSTTNVVEELFQHLDKFSAEDRGRSFLLLSSEISGHDADKEMDQVRNNWLDRIAESFLTSPPVLRPQLLLAASIVGHGPMVARLLYDIAADGETSPKINAVQTECLIEAVMNRHFGIVKQLLEGEQFPNISGCNAVLQALEISCSNDSVDITGILLPRYLSYCSATGAHHPRLIRLALSHNQFDIVEILLKHDPRGTLYNVKELISALRDEVEQAVQVPSDITTSTSSFVAIVAAGRDGKTNDAVMWDTAALAHGISSGNTVLVRFMVKHVHFCKEELTTVMKAAQDMQKLELVEIISARLDESAVQQKGVEALSSPPIAPTLAYSDGESVEISTGASSRDLQILPDVIDKSCLVTTCCIQSDTIGSDRGSPIVVLEVSPDKLRSQSIAHVEAVHIVGSEAVEQAISFARDSVATKKVEGAWENVPKLSSKASSLKENIDDTSSPEKLQMVHQFSTTTVELLLDEGKHAMVLKARMHPSISDTDAKNEQNGDDDAMQLAAFEAYAPILNEDTCEPPKTEVVVADIEVDAPVVENCVDEEQSEEPAEFPFSMDQDHAHVEDDQIQDQDYDQNEEFDSASEEMLEEQCGESFDGDTDGSGDSASIDESTITPLDAFSRTEEAAVVNNESSGTSAITVVIEEGNSLKENGNSSESKLLVSPTPELHAVVTDGIAQLVDENMAENPCSNQGEDTSVMMPTTLPIADAGSNATKEAHITNPPIQVKIPEPKTQFVSTSSAASHPTRSTIICPVEWVVHPTDTTSDSACAVETTPPLHEGDRVKVRRKSRSVLLPGVIAFCHSNGSYDVVYEDGEEEGCVARKFIELQASSDNDGQCLQNDSDNIKVLVSDKRAAPVLSQCSSKSSRCSLADASQQQSDGQCSSNIASSDSLDFRVDQNACDDNNEEDDTIVIRPSSSKIQTNDIFSEPKLNTVPNYSKNLQPDRESFVLNDHRTVVDNAAETESMIEVLVLHPPQVSESSVENVVKVEHLPEIPSVIIPSKEFESIASYSTGKELAEVRFPSRTSQRDGITSQRSRCRTADNVSVEEMEEWKNVDLLLNRKRRFFQSQTGNIEGIKVPWGEEFATIQSLRRFATKHPDVLRAHIETQLLELNKPLSSPGKSTLPRARGSSAQSGIGQARDSLLLMKDLAFLLKLRLAPFFDAIVPVVLPTIFSAEKRFLCETATEVLDAIILHCSGRKLALLFLQLGETYSKYEDLRLYNLTSVYVEKCVRNWKKPEVVALQSSQSSALLLSLLANALVSKSAPVRISIQKTVRYLRDELGIRSFEAVLKAHVPPDVEALVLDECNATSVGLTKLANRRSSRRSQQEKRANTSSQIPTIVQSSPSILQRMLLQRQNRVMPT